MIRNISLLPLLIVSASLYTSASGQAQSKRGLAYVGGGHASDNNLLTSAQSLISWYYTWSLNPTKAVNASTPFVPLVHAVSDAENTKLGSILNDLPASSYHLLTFNEPDGTTDSGGSSISPEDAARTYLDRIVPLRTTKPRSWNISHPSVTGSGRGLDWLRSFNASCYKLDSKGCPTDFVAVHWYGDFGGLSAWLESLRNFYNPSNSTNGPKFWVTELGLPQANKDTTLAMMKQTLPYLDKLDYVDRYAWFGAFRSDEANGWTGSGLSLFDDDGGLTELGALYLGGEERGFTKGTKGQGADQGAANTLAISIWAVVFAALIPTLCLW